MFLIDIIDTSVFLKIFLVYFLIFYYPTMY